MDNQNRPDRINEISHEDSILLPIAHYALVNSKNANRSYRPKIVINGLGSCIALILFDPKNEIYAMSHILLPSTKIANNKSKIEYPHKYADSSVKHLLNELKTHGAQKENIKAIIIGGANIFKDEFNKVAENNIQAVRNELRSNNIKIERQDLGGNKGRIVIFNTEEISVFVKGTGDKGFMKLL